jgi:hypothetical protein
MHNLSVYDGVDAEPGAKLLRGYPFEAGFVGDPMEWRSGVDSNCRCH